MIRTAHVRNFRCLRDVQISLGPLVVLVGPTAAGKSALLDALCPSHPVTLRDRWRHDSECVVSFELTFDEGPPSWRAVAETHVDRSASRPFRDYRYQRLHLDPARIAQPNRVEHETVLASDGGNLANVLASLPRRAQVAVAERLCALVPAVQDVDVRPYQTTAGKHRLLFQDAWHPSTWFTGEDVSDGVLLLLAFLTVSTQSPLPELLVVEEPERGLQPPLLHELLEELRRLGTGRSPVQVVIATQSADLLDQARPDEVRFVARDERDGATRVRTLGEDRDGWQRAWREHRLPARR